MLNHIDLTGVTRGVHASLMGISLVSFDKHEKYKIHVKSGTEEGVDFDILQDYPVVQEEQHCFAFLTCDCLCCFPEIIDKRDDLGRGEILIVHQWIQ